MNNSRDGQISLAKIFFSFYQRQNIFFYQDEEDIVELAKKLLFKGGKAFLADAEIRWVGYQTLDPWEKVKI